MFDHIASHVERSHISKVLLKLSDRCHRLQLFVDDPSTAEPVRNDKGVDISKYQAPAELKQTQEEINELKVREKKVRDDPNKRISIRDLDAALRSLGRSCTRKQLEYMIWEVDENLDQHVDWHEVRAGGWGGGGI